MGDGRVHLQAVLHEALGEVVYLGSRSLQGKVCVDGSVPLHFLKNEDGVDEARFVPISQAASVGFVEGLLKMQPTRHDVVRGAKASFLFRLLC